MEGNFAKTRTLKRWSQSHREVRLSEKKDSEKDGEKKDNMETCY